MLKWLLLASSLFVGVAHADDGTGMGSQLRATVGTGTPVSTDLVKLFRGGAGDPVYVTVGSLTTGTITSFTNQPTFSNSGGFIVQPSGLQGFELISGSTGVNVAPVPTFYPVTNNKGVAFDLIPHGAPTDLGFGVAWNDICNSDLVANFVAATSCLHLAARSGSTGMQIGTAMYNAGTIQPLQIGRFNGDTAVFTSDIIIPTAGGVQLPTIANAAGNQILCYNTTGGTVTYQTAVAGCVPSAVAAKNILGTINTQVALAGVMQLTPGIYSYKDTATLDAAEHDGLYADQICKIDERLCVRDNDGTIKNYDTRGVIAHLVAAVQELQHQLDTLKRHGTAWAYH